jgi:type VI secretion system secreted protein VgrG
MAYISEKEPKEKIDGLPDAREDSRADNILNTTITKTRSGHVLELNDNEGVEHVTLQHRSGSLVQMQPDGSVRFVSQNGMMGFEINGEGYVKVTGAYNIIVDGGATLRADSYDVHVENDLNLTVGGTFAVAAKNMALAISEKYELIAQTSSLGTSGNSVFTAGKQLYMGSDLDLDIVSGATTTIVGTTKIDLNP